MTSRHHALCLFVALFTTAASASAVTLGQIDDFQDGTTQGWGSGAISSVPPVNLPDSGPTGVGDHSLLITSLGGIGPGSRFVAFNTTQWAGDFPAAGVERITLDLNNLGVVTLNMRVALEGAGGRFVSTLSVPVLSGGGWQSIQLSLLAADLTSAGGFNVNATLAAVTQLRLISAAAPAFQGDPIATQGLIDNVTAGPEPELIPALPAGGLVVLVAAMAAAGRRFLR